jgi:hypothetical protein
MAHDDDDTTPSTDNPDNVTPSADGGRGDALARRQQAAGEEPEETLEERLRREGAAGLNVAVKEWVWVSTLGIYMNRADPSIVLRKDAFNDKFRYLKPEAYSLTNFLHRRYQNTILKPDRVVYRPNQGEFLKAGREWNLWRPSEIVSQEGDTTMWDGQLAHLFPDQKQRDHLLDWLAGVLQRLEVKPLHALLLIGAEQGTGKSWVLRVLAKLIGDANWRPLTQDILASGFTGWAMRTKLVTVEELRSVSKSELANKLHPWITQKEMSVNEKNLPSFILDQVIAFVFMSNRLDAIRVDNSDRRYLVLKTEARPHPGGDAYYTRLYDLLEDKAALGAILHQLMTRNLKGYNICGRAPETAAKDELKKATASDLVKWIAENSGETPWSYKAVTLKEIEDEVPQRIRVGTGHIIEAMEQSGYWACPKQIQPGGRGGKKLRVWLHPSVEGREALAPAQVQRLYVDERPEKYSAEGRLRLVLDTELE